MTREEKAQVIDDLTTLLTDKKNIYLTDISGLNASNTSELRKNCFKAEVNLRVVKNTLLRKAMERVEGKDFEPLYDTLKGNTAILLSDTGNAPAKIIKAFRKKSDKPVLKSAFVQECIYVGDDQLDSLVNVKSRNELIGDIIGMLQAPLKNILSGLQSEERTNVSEG